MASLAEICSLALLQLGAEAITSLEGEDLPVRAKLCRAFYPFIRDAVLRAYPWNCAKVTDSLPALSESPADTNWAYQFNLPVSPYCLWVPKTLNEDLSYEVRGRKLLANDSPVTITYICRIMDTGLYDSLLVEAIAARLAHQLAYPITGSSSLSIEIWKLYDLKLREARTIDSMEGDQRVYESNVLTDVR